MKRSELRRDPDKVREWIQRGSWPFPRDARRPLKRSATPLKRSARKTREKIPAGVRKRAMARSKRRCIVCKGRAVHLHHVLPVRLFPALSRHEDNLVGICAECHEYHERAVRRIRWQQLPECAITLAHTTSGAAVVYMERTYPR